MSEATRSWPPPRGNRTPSSAAKLAAELAAERKADDIVVLDLAASPESSAVTDYFLICTGRSDIHVHAICERIVQGMRAHGLVPMSTEGCERGQWALLDYGDVVVHVFQESVRKHYDLERLWAQAPRWTYRNGSAIEEGLA